MASILTRDQLKEIILFTTLKLVWQTRPADPGSGFLPEAALAL
jgi:hypothetical protein